MIQKKINKVAVIGSGIMGSRIACHFANIGVEILLLDILPKSINKMESDKGLSLQDVSVRNRIVNDALKNTLKSKPAFHNSPLNVNCVISEIFVFCAISVKLYGL